MRLIFFLTCFYIIHSEALATKPCPPAKSLEQLQKVSSWIAVAKLIKKEERKEPYPNCYNKDQTKCEMQDVSVLRFEVTRWKKGPRQDKLLNVTPSYCSRSVPVTIGSFYIIYGTHPGEYDQITGHSEPQKASQ